MEDPQSPQRELENSENVVEHDEPVQNNTNEVDNQDENKFNFTDSLLRTFDKVSSWIDNVIDDIDSQINSKFNSENSLNAPPPPAQPTESLYDKTTSFFKALFTFEPFGKTEVPPSRPSWIDTTYTNYKRSLTRLPLSVDIPRLVKHITLVDCRNGDFKVCFRGSSSYCKEGITCDNSDTIPQLYNFFSILSLLVHGEDKKKVVEDTFYKFLDIEQSIDIQRDEFYDFLLNTYGEDDIVSRTLKCVNQSIIAPAIIFLRTKISSKFQFKDASSRIWEVVIKVFDDKVEITHLRNQVSTAKDSYSFIWKLIYNISKDNKDEFNAHMGLVDVLTFGDKMDERKELRKQIIDIFKTVFTEEYPDENAEEKELATLMAEEIIYI